MIIVPASGEGHPHSRPFFVDKKFICGSGAARRHLKTFIGLRLRSKSIAISLRAECAVLAYGLQYAATNLDEWRRTSTRVAPIVHSCANQVQDLSIHRRMPDTHDACVQALFR